VKFYVIFGKKIIMLRIGKLPVLLPKGVSVNRNDENIIIKGPHGLLEREIPSIMDVEILEDRLLIKPNVESRIAKQFHGLFRTLINNMVIGVSEQFTKQLELKGVGYRCQVSNNTITLNLGYSHPIEMQIPKQLTIKVENNTSISVTGIEKEEVGLFASQIRGFRPPEPYNGKGVLYKGEVIIRKQGKVGK
jgi:large subunit ribosomal protein L6